MDAGIDGEKAASLWNGVVLKSNKDATEDDLKSESVEYSLRKSSRFADETVTFQEKAARAWKEMQSKSAEDGGRSWLEDSPLARMCTQAESLEASIKAVAKRLPIERTHLLPIAGVLDISSSMKSAETEKSLEGLMENVKGAVHPHEPASDLHKNCDQRADATAEEAEGCAAEGRG